MTYHKFSIDRYPWVSSANVKTDDIKISLALLSLELFGFPQLEVHVSYTCVQQFMFIISAALSFNLSKESKCRNFFRVFYVFFNDQDKYLRKINQTTFITSFFLTLPS